MISSTKRPIRKLRDEGPVFTHARPIYKQDETASKRDEALIVLLRGSGFLCASIALINLEGDVFYRNDGTLQIDLPSVKTRYDLESKLVLVGRDAGVLHGWISCRRLMQVRSGALFVTSNGESVDNNDITQMMYKLGQCAG
jgi:site-specific recombinase XerC